jgi:hypothetical protein
MYPLTRLEDKIDYSERQPVKPYESRLEQAYMAVASKVNRYSPSGPRPYVQTRKGK